LKSAYTNHVAQMGVGAGFGFDSSVESLACRSVKRNVDEGILLFEALNNLHVIRYHQKGIDLQFSFLLSCFDDCLSFDLLRDSGSREDFAVEPHDKRETQKQFRRSFHRLSPFNRY